jgi:uncharacterized protein YjbI with pentapeptide repeats
VAVREGDGGRAAGRRSDSLGSGLGRVDRALVGAGRWFRRPSLWVPSAAVALVLISWVLPWALSLVPSVEGAERHKAMADIRTGMIALVAAVGGVGGLAYTARTFHMAQLGQLTGRFESASKQLGDADPAIKIAGVYLMAQLADEWPEQRQTCIGALCAYLRASDVAPAGEADRTREVRRTVLDVMASHLREGARVSWDGYDFDMIDAALDTGDLSGVVLTAGRWRFRGARFVGALRFDGARFEGADVDFGDARFTGDQCAVSFAGAVFSSGRVSFRRASFEGGQVCFDGAKFESGCRLPFAEARFAGASAVSFRKAMVRGMPLEFESSAFLPGQGEVCFDELDLEGRISFEGSGFGGRQVSFEKAQLKEGVLSFRRAVFEKGRLRFKLAFCKSATIELDGADSEGGCLDFTETADGAPRTIGERSGLLCLS